MKRMTKVFGFVTAAVMLFVFTGESGAFCVHNKSDSMMTFKEVSGDKWGRGFQKKLDPGQDACCHWSNKDCNKSGKKDASIGFDVYYGDYGGVGHAINVCGDKKIPACSDLDVTGSKGHYECVAHGMETCN